MLVTPSLTALRYFWMKLSAYAVVFGLSILKLKFCLVVRRRLSLSFCVSGWVLSESILLITLVLVFSMSWSIGLML